MLVYCRVVNKSRGGAPEQLVFQRQDNLERIEPETITKVKIGENFRNPNMNEDIEYVLRNMGHYCYIDYQDNGEYRHTLILE